MKSSPILIITMILLVSLVLSACSTGGQTAGLSGSSWKLVSFGAVNDPTPAVADIDTKLVFDREGQISGNLGCNGFGGKYEVKDDTVTFSEVVSTMMACAEPQMTQEGAAFKVLNGTARYTLEGDTLQIIDSNGESALRFERIK